VTPLAPWGPVASFWQSAHRHESSKVSLCNQQSAAKAKAAFQDFLTLWKDADADNPILIAAKVEYAKLH
jgi:hypothetical protein